MFKNYHYFLLFFIFQDWILNRRCRATQASRVGSGARKDQSAERGRLAHTHHLAVRAQELHKRTEATRPLPQGLHCQVHYPQTNLTNFHFNSN